MNVYTLPDGNVQISFSGGRTSAFMLHQIAEANGGLPSRVEVVFTNTGREFPQTLDFVAEVGVRWGILINWVEYRRASPGFELVGYQGASRNGEPFDALIDAKQRLPNIMERTCTEYLKVRAANAYLKSLGWEVWTNATGIRADEAHRLEEKKHKKPRKQSFEKWRPLADAGVTKHDVALFWRKQPFDLRLPIVKGVTIRGNCDGCFLKSEATRAALIRDFPDRAAWWEAAEARIGAQQEAKGKPKTNGRFSKRGSWANLRDFVQRQGDWIFKDDVDALCQKDGGECVE